MRTNQELTAVTTFPGLSAATFEVIRHNAPEDNQAATAETIGYILEGAAIDSCSAVVRRATRDALQRAGVSRQERAAAIFQWVRSHVRFRHDEEFLEGVLGLEDELDLLIRPAALLSLADPEEDCDGFTMLTMSMLLAASIPCRPITIKADRARPWRWSHIYCEALIDNGSWLALDASKGPYPGWAPPQWYELCEWDQLTPAPRSCLQGYVGLGDTYDYGGEYGAPDPTTIDTSSVSGTDWGSVLTPLIKGGIDIAKQVTLPPGAYVQTAGGVMARGVPGAIPGQFPGVGLNFGTSGFGMPLLIFGGLALAVAAVAGGRH